MLEAFEAQNENSDSTDVKYTHEQLVTEIEGYVFDFSGKNSKDKSYREKAKKILTRIKGNRNSVVRGLLRMCTITTLEFCKLTDKQLDDDSYFEKFGKNGNSSNQNVNKPKGVSIKPPNFKNVPIHAVDLSSSPTDVNDYYNSIQANEGETNENPEATYSNIIEEERNLSQLNNFSNVESHNINDDNVSNRVNTEIETNSVRTDTFSIREENREIPAVIGRVSPRENNGRSVNFKAPSRNVENNYDNLPNHQNKTYDGGININNMPRKENLNNTLNENIQSVKVEKTSSKNEHLIKLKELMEKKRIGKSLVSPVSKDTTLNKLPPQTTLTEVKQQEIESSQNIIEVVHCSTNAHNQNNNYVPVSVNTETDISLQNNNFHNIPNKSFEGHINISKPVEEEPHHARNPFDTPENQSVNTKKPPTSNPTIPVNNKLSHKMPIILPNKPIHSNNPIVQQPQSKNIFDEDLSVQDHNFNNSHNLNNANNQHQSSKELKQVEFIEEKREEVKEVSEMSEMQASPNFSPKNESRSELTQSNLRNFTNTIASKDQSFISMRDKMRNFQETKVSLETQLEFSNKKCEIYEKEMQILRKTVNELKLQLSKTNEEAFKLEISRLKQSLSSSDKEKEMLKKENLNLKSQVKKYDENIDDILEENRKFRNDTQRKFTQYNKEIENLTIRTSTVSNVSNFSNIPFSLKESVIQKKDDLIKAKEEDNFIYTENNNMNNFKREVITNKKTFTANNNIHIGSHYNQNNSFHANENTIANNKSNIIEIDEANDNLMVHNINNHNENNFTNGSPNLIEEVGADNYLNMNGNTYDEMKDLKQDDDNLQDHQYYENSHSQPNANYDPVNMEYTHFNNKKANTGDTYNNLNNYLNTNSTGGESGATNNIFGNPEEEKGDEIESIFDYKSGHQGQTQKAQKSYNPQLKEKSNKVIKNEREQTQQREQREQTQQREHKNSSNVTNINKPSQNTGNKRNIFEENAFDIFDKSDNAVNIFETFAKKAPVNNLDVLFDS